jgi:hypothetical protein
MRYLIILLIANVINSLNSSLVSSPNNSSHANCSKLNKTVSYVNSKSPIPTVSYVNSKSPIPTVSYVNSKKPIPTVSYKPTLSYVYSPSPHPTPNPVVKQLKILPTSVKVVIKQQENKIQENKIPDKNNSEFIIIIFIIFILFVLYYIIRKLIKRKPTEKKMDILPLHSPKNSSNSPNNEKYYGFQTPSPGLYRRNNSYSSFT